MKLRKILAGVLCSAMIFTELMGTVSFASELDASDNNLYAQSEEIVETDESTEVIVPAGDGVTEEINEESGGDEKSVVEEVLTTKEEELNDDLDDSIIEVEDEELTDLPATDIFQIVSSNGLLKLKDGITKITQSTVVIPGKIADEYGQEHYVKKIPVGIFDTANSDIQSIAFQKDNQVEEIEAGAFMGCPMTSFVFPAPYNDSGVLKGVTEIGNDTFRNCTKLSVVEFNGCKIDSIGEYAFSRTAITEFTAPGEYNTGDAKKTIIKKGAFESCSVLRSIYLYEVEEVGVEAFKDCVLLGKVGGSVRMTADQKKLGDGAFTNCGFTVFDMSEASSLVEYGKNLFERCVTLTDIFLPSVACDISDYMFNGCTKLKNVHMRTYGYAYGSAYPRVIGEHAFSGCSAIQSITLPETVQEIGASAFADCTNLSTVEILTRYILDESKFIQKNSLPDKESALTVKGYTDFLEEYSLKKKYKYVDLDDKIEVKASFGGSNSSKAKVSISPAKAKRGQEVVVTVTIDDKNSALIQNANGSYISLQTGNAPIKYYNNYEANIRMESCTNTVQKFSFIMPSDIEKGDSLYIKGTVAAVKDNAKAEETINVGFSKKSVGVDFIESDPEIQGDPHIVFNKTGQQLRLRFTDADGRVISPWRFTYKVSTNGQKMVSVSNEGVVSAISRKSSDNMAIITATLTSSGKVVKVIATVDDNILIDTLDFGIRSTQMPKRSKYYGKNYENLGSEAGSYNFTRDESVYDKDGNFKYYVTRNYNMIVIPKTAVQNEAVSFKLNVFPKYKDVKNGGTGGTGDESYMVSATWSSGDTSIAKVANSNTTNNENTITIPKGTLGDTEIRVKVENLGEDEDSEDRIFESSFIVRVVNDIPRLTENSITINTNSEKGIKLPIVISDDFPVGDDTLKFDVKKTVNKIVTYEANQYGIVIVRDEEDGAYYAKLKSSTEAPAAGKTVEYKNLVLTGKFKEGGEEFRLPIGSVKVVNTALSSNVSMTGKINLFYRNDLNDAETKELLGRVKVTQSLTSEEVIKEVLMSEKSYKKMIDRSINYRYEELAKPGSQLNNLLSDDANADGTNAGLSANFSIDYDSADRQWYIERTVTPMIQEEGKDIVSGYIFTYFKGYPLPVIKKITVPTEKTKPSYVLDYTSTTVNTNRKGTSYNLMLLDSKTKKPPVRTWVDQYNKTHKEYRNLLNCENPDSHGTNKSATMFAYDLDKTTSGLFVTSSTAIAEVASDKIKLPDLVDSTKTVDFVPWKINVQLAGITPIKGQAVLRVKLYNWSDYIDYKFSVATTGTLTKMKMNATTVTYNTNATELPAELAFNLDQSYAFIMDLGEDGMKGSAKVSGEDMSTWVSGDIQGIKCTNTIRSLEDEASIKELLGNMYVNWNSPKNGGIIGVAGADGSKIKKGNYSFSFVPRVAYEAGAPSADWKKTNKVSFTIAVTDKKPTVKLSTSSFKLNGQYPDNDYKTTVYSFTNVPVQLAYVADSNKYVLNVDSCEVNCKEKQTTEHTYTKACTTHYADKIGLYEGVDPADEKHKMIVYLDSGEIVPDFSRTFRVEKAQLKMGETNVDLDAFDVKVESKKADTKVDYKTYGSINPVDDKSGIVVRFSISNLATELTPVVSVWEFKEDNLSYETPSRFMAELITDSNYDIEDPTSKYYGYPNIALDSHKKVVKNQVIITPVYNSSHEFDKPMVKDQKYNVRLRFSLKTGEAKETKTISITPKQEVPGLNVKFALPKSANSSSMSTIMYACNDKQSDCLVRVNPKSQSNAVITGVSLANSASAALKRAYAAEYYDAEYNYTNGTYKVYHLKKDATREEITDNNVLNPTAMLDEYMYKLVSESEDQYRRSFKTDEEYKKTEGHYFVYIKLLNAAPLVMNKGTNIDFEVRYKNQIKDKLDKPTPGSTFKINVTVKK